MKSYGTARSGFLDNVVERVRVESPTIRATFLPWQNVRRIVFTHSMCAPRTAKIGPVGAHPPSRGTTRTLAGSVLRMRLEYRPVYGNFRS